MRMQDTNDNEQFYRSSVSAHPQTWDEETYNVDRIIYLQRKHGSRPQLLIANETVDIIYTRVITFQVKQYLLAETLNSLEISLIVKTNDLPE